MLECLHDIVSFTHFYETTNNDIDVLNSLNDISHIVFNRDYTPFAEKRDQDIIDWAQNNDIKCTSSYQEYSLVDILI